MAFAGATIARQQWRPKRRLPVCALAVLTLATLAGVTSAFVASHAACAGETAGPLRAVSIGVVRHAVGAWSARIADGSFETSTGRALRWLPYDTDSAVAAAMASGRVDIGMLGTSVAAAAYARGLDIKIFYVMGSTAGSDGLLAQTQSSINSGEPRSLLNKVVAVPFGSTPHFRLLLGLRQWGLAPTAVRLVNLQAQQIASAWSHHEIDAAMVGEPVLSQLAPGARQMPMPESGGTTLVLVTSGHFVAESSVLLARIVDVIARAESALGPDSSAGVVEPSALRSIAFLTGLDPEVVAAGVARQRPPGLEEQLSPRFLGGGAASQLAAALRADCEVWRWAGRIDRADQDFIGAISTEPLEQALAFRK